MLAKILIKERENYAQLADCGINYFEEGLLSCLWGQADFSSKKWL